MDKKALNILNENSVEKKFKYIYTMFREQDVIKNFQISNATFMSFLAETEKLYNKNKNPFHNFDHGITGRPFFLVLNGCYNFLKFTVCHNFFVTPISEAALLFAGFMHDIDHTGRNNDFMKKSLHPLSIAYNDQSVGIAHPDLGESPRGYCLPPAEGSEY